MTDTHLQYEPASHVPLIQSPSLRVPKPVELPPDIHPLPESVTAYFVYPFTLEPHILTLESARRTTLAAHAAKRDQFLRAREGEKERRKRDALRQIAPGFEPRSGTLVPTKRNFEGPMVTSAPPAPPMDEMDEMVAQLARLDAETRL